MKKHAIIPIFIPHTGCPCKCVFCNQNLITARSKPPSCEEVSSITEKYLATLEGRNIDIEIAFYGGSFTGIPLIQQRQYLSVAYEYKKSGRVKKIHMSTRPDYISREILDNLKEFDVDVIELGVQSFDDKVLRLSKRGHTSHDVLKACELIRQYNFELGIQLMVGLPGDNIEKAIKSAKTAAALKPSLARLYPTVVLPDTELAHMLKNKEYIPLNEKESIEITKEMYKILMQNNINIMRVGLKSTDLMTKHSDLSSEYHPAFRQLVEGEIAKEQMKHIFYDIIGNISKINNEVSIRFTANEKWFNPMIGHKGCNKKYFDSLNHLKNHSDKSYTIHVLYGIDNTLPDGKISFDIKLHNFISN